VKSSPDPERYVLGCILLEPERSMARCAAYKVDSEWFTIPAAILAWQTIAAMGDIRPELAAVCHKAGKDPACPADMMQFLLGCEEFAHSPSSIDYYLTEMREAYKARRLRRMAQEALSRVDAGDKPDEILGGVQAEATAIGTVGQVEQTREEHLSEVRKEFEDAKKLGGLGIPDPWMQLQSITRGMQRGHTRVVAGWPKAGKTTTALNMLRHWLQAGHSCGLISLEMSEKLCRTKLAADMTGANMDKLRTGNAGKRELDTLMEAYKETLDFPLYVHAGPHTIEQIVGLIHGNKGRWEVVMIDYLQIISRTKHDPDGDASCISRWSAAITNAIRAANMACIIVSQLNRESHASRKPHYRYLKGSGSIEQDCSELIMVYQDPAVGDEEYYDNAPTIVDVQLQRMGGGGSTRFVFEKSKQRMVPEVAHVRKEAQ